MTRRASKNAYCARSNDTPCLLRLIRSLTGSQAKLDASPSYGEITIHYGGWIVRPPAPVIIGLTRGVLYGILQLEPRLKAQDALGPAQPILQLLSRAF